MNSPSSFNFHFALWPLTFLVSLILIVWVSVFILIRISRNRLQKSKDTNFTGHSTNNKTVSDDELEIVINDEHIDNDYHRSTLVSYLNNTTHNNAFNQRYPNED